MHTFRIGQKDQEFRSCEVADERGQPVVVAERDLVDRHRVVLVDYRNRSETQQTVERVPRIQIALALHEVVSGQQHLRADRTALLEHACVSTQQATLPHRGGSLKRRDVGRACLEAEGAESRADRARRHQDHVDAGLLEIRDPVT
jgi:hypothetical protein